MRKILIGTALLGLLGAVSGALAGALAIGAVAVVSLFSSAEHTGGPEFSLSLALLFVAAVGFVAGALAAPILTWTLLRRVPIWRAAVETAVAASLAFLAAGLYLQNLWLAGLVAAGAASLAALRLRFAFRASAAAPANEESQLT